MGSGNKQRKVLIIERIMSCATVLVIVLAVVSIFVVKEIPAQCVRIVGIIFGIAGVTSFALATITVRDSWRVGIPEEKTSL